MDGNGSGTCTDDVISSTVEMDVFESTTFDGSLSCNGSTCLTLSCFVVVRVIPFLVFSEVKYFCNDSLNINGLCS